MTEEARGNGASTALVERDESAETPERIDIAAPVEADGVGVDRAALRVRARANLGKAAAALGRVIAWLATLAGMILVLGIVFEVLGANSRNGIVLTVESAGKTLAAPFEGMFTPPSVKLALAINWAIAIVVYGVAGGLLAGRAAQFAVRLGIGSKH